MVYVGRDGKTTRQRTRCGDPHFIVCSTRRRRRDGDDNNKSERLVGSKVDVANKRHSAVRNSIAVCIGKYLNIRKIERAWKVDGSDVIRISKRSINQCVRKRVTGARHQRRILTIDQRAVLRSNDQTLICDRILNIGDT